MVGENGWDDEPWRCWVDDMIDSDPIILELTVASQPAHSAMIPHSLGSLPNGNPS